MSYQADDLLVEIRRAGSLPAATGTGVGTDDADLLAHADSEARDTLVPLIQQVSEEFYERVFDATATIGQPDYRLNKRVSLSRINTVQWVNSASQVFNLARLDPKRVAELQILTTTGRPWAFYLEGSRVMLFPSPGEAGTLRIRAFVRPGRLALAAATGSKAITLVTGSAATSWVLTIASGHGWTTGTPIDVVSGTPSFEYLVLDAIPSATATGSVTIAGSSSSTAPAIGDYVCAPDTSPFIQLPVELHPALVELTTARVLRALGKSAEAGMHAQEAQRLAGIAIQALTPRTEAAERKIVGGPHWRKRMGRNWGTW